MQYYFAPLEGLTDSIYRNLHHKYFPGVDRYYTPFFSPTIHRVLTQRESRELPPADTLDACVIPQVLCKVAEDFVWMAHQCADLGYTQVNLNLGCPSGTVTAKGKGSGMLRDPESLDAFLEGIFRDAPLPISVKTRIGFSDPAEWQRLLEIYNQYPICELIIHPRTRKQLYGGAVHGFAVEEALTQTSAPIVYNGDLFTPEDCLRVFDNYTGLCAIMLGRGLIANPALARQIKGGEGITVNSLKDFHSRLYDAYSMLWPKNFLVGHMHETMEYMACCFEDTHKARKALRKATTREAYLEAANLLFESCALKADPYFSR